MSVIRAIYENGVFLPLTPVNLPEHSKVEFELNAVGSDAVPSLSEVYETLRARFSSDEQDVAARHDEHQP
jgi:predicted DNA-binding antitoxin AbrB/MazE fold protein